MSTIRILGAVALMALTACYSQDSTYAQSTIPPQPPNTMYGPPGGGMDPSYGYQQPPPGYQGAYQQPQDPQAYQDGNYADPNAPQDQSGPPGGEAYGDPSQVQPMDPSGAAEADPSLMGSVDDTEIDATLQAYGSWEQDPENGRVWRPDPTAVGADFTPYETCGSWVDTEYGWSFNCDYSWGWLPFHYGRWAWTRGYWGWIPGHQWGPAWVEWRHGGGYVGWRPLGPEHGRLHDSAWRFATERDFTKPHVRSHLFQNPAEGLRVTQPVARPSLRGPAGTVHAATLMQARVASPTWNGARATNVRSMATAQPPVRSYQPAVRANEQTYRPSYQPGVRGYTPGVRSYPSGGATPGVRSYPTHSYQTQGTFHPGAPSHGAFSAPSHSFSPPAHSSGGSSSHSSGGGGHSSGGGHHR